MTARLSRRRVLHYTAMAAAAGAVASVKGSMPAAIGTAPADDPAIRDFVTKMYQAIKFDRGESLDGNRLRQLMHPGARIAWSTAAGFELVDVDDFIERFVAGFEADGIWSLREHSLGMKVHRFGEVAQVFDTYEAVFNEGEIVARGVNAYQLIKQNHTWKCAALAWSEETPEQPLP